MTKIVGLTLPYHDQPFERALEGLVAAGYRYVAFGTAHAGDPVPTEEDPAESARVRALFRSFGLKPEVLFAHSQFHPDLPSGRAVRMLELASELEIPEVNTLGFWGYRTFPDIPLPPDEYEALNDRFVARYQALARDAERLGVRITLKPHTGNTATGPILLDTLKRIGSPFVKACYDPGNVGYYAGVDPETDLPSVADEVVSFVAKEQGRRGLRSYDFSVPGEGDYDFPGMFGLLRARGFDGPVIVEKLDRDGKPIPPEETDRRAERARHNLERLLIEAGFTVE
ncbi:sugar phosphate isomerase/epimerase [Paenibacillus sp.]|uniref:sugar phosphate isomerase/epimerase family protein n=1 Tax=Paenibacillus sp. TaxID=58172 RepID=UPI002812228E|nr:sugar phosphate isomerase/epimerase [Paenibacillus sp.]